MMGKEEMRTKIVQKVEDTLKARDKSGALKDECDFLAGAMTVLQQVNMLIYDSTEKDSMEIVPPMWMLLPMCGRSVIEELSNK